ncbi:hypothetical protein D3C72_1911010 [compost metagenome]
MYRQVGVVILLVGDEGQRVDEGHGAIVVAETEGLDQFDALYRPTVEVGQQLGAGLFAEGVQAVLGLAVHVLQIHCACLSRWAIRRLAGGWES